MGVVSRISSRFRGRELRADVPAVRAASIDDLSADEFVRLAFRLILGREADSAALDLIVPMLESGRLSRDRAARNLIESPECRLRPWNEGTPAGRARFWLEALHRSRVQAISSLPKADVIVDLGGSCEGDPRGAMINYGYPYTFRRLSIVDLPRERRHAIYAEISGEYREVIRTPQGPVDYVYTSMSDLSAYADGSIDLVYSGQSIEHVTREDAAATCREVFRILRPGGHFCLDTPNRAVTRFQNATAYSNPDHKYEYEHAELAALLRDHGFVIEEAKGLSLASQSLARGEFVMEEGLDRAFMYDDIASCYLLYYRCRKP